MGVMLKDSSASPAVALWRHLANPQGSARQILVIFVRVGRSLMSPASSTPCNKTASAPALPRQTQLGAVSFSPLQKSEPNYEARGREREEREDGGVFTWS